jgi:hypothetical protein
VAPELTVALNVAVVPVNVAGVPYNTSVAGTAVKIENELKPEPVKVTVVAAEPTVMGVVELEDVITGATSLASPTPKAFRRGNLARLFPAPVLVTVNAHIAAVVGVTARVAVPAVGLVIAAPVIA